QGDGRPVLLPLRLLGDDVVAELDALVADVDRGAGDELPDFPLPLPAEGAGQVAVMVAVLPAHVTSCSCKCTRRTRGPATIASGKPGPSVGIYRCATRHARNAAARPLDEAGRRRPRAAAAPPALTPRAAPGRARAKRRSAALPTLSPPEAPGGPPVGRRTYALRLAYDGAAFRGWQRQPGLPTVEQATLDALAGLLAEEVRLHAAARTDAGVHAEAQVASFSMRRAFSARDLEALRLPAGLAITAAAPARPSFHARASASGKQYRYRFAAGSRTAWDLGRKDPDWERARAALEGL